MKHFCLQYCMFHSSHGPIHNRAHIPSAFHIAKILLSLPINHFYLQCVSCLPQTDARLLGAFHIASYSSETTSNLFVLAFPQSRTFPQHRLYRIQFVSTFQNSLSLQVSAQGSVISMFARRYISCCCCHLSSRRCRRWSMFRCC